MVVIILYFYFYFYFITLFCKIVYGDFDLIYFIIFYVYFFFCFIISTLLFLMFIFFPNFVQQGILVQTLQDIGFGAAGLAIYKEVLYVVSLRVIAQYNISDNLKKIGNFVNFAFVPYECLPTSLISWGEAFYLTCGAFVGSNVTFPILKFSLNESDYGKFFFHFFSYFTLYLFFFIFLFFYLLVFFSPPLFFLMIVFDLIILLQSCDPFFFYFF